MTPEKKLARRDRNVANKIVKAEIYRQKQIALGKTVIVTENEDGTKSYAFPPKQKGFSLNIPRLQHIIEKTKKTGVPRKNAPGLKPEHTAALTENASRSFAKEVDKALGIPEKGPIAPPVPMVSPTEMRA